MEAHFQRATVVPCFPCLRATTRARDPTLFVSVFNHSAGIFTHAFDRLTCGTRSVDICRRNNAAAVGQRTLSSLPRHVHRANASLQSMASGARAAAAGPR